MSTELPLTELFVIRSKSGEFYKPTPYGNFWKPTLKKAKIYTKIGPAKCAITTKLEHWEHISKPKSWLNPSKEELEMYGKFVNCEIVKVGLMNGIENSVVFQQKTC